MMAAQNEQRFKDQQLIRNTMEDINRNVYEANLKQVLEEVKGVKDKINLYSNQLEKKIFNEDKPEEPEAPKMVYGATLEHVEALERAAVAMDKILA